MTTAHIQYSLCRMLTNSGRQIVASRSNSAVKRIRSLRQRKAREETGLFFAEGARMVSEAIQTNARIEMFVIAPEMLDTPFGRQLLQGPCRGRAPCLEVTKEVYQALAERDNAQGIGVVARQRWERLDSLRPERGRLWVALDGVQYPGNLGAILRASDAAGGAGVLLLGSTTDPHDPAAVRASAGAIFSQILVRARFEEFAAWKKRNGCFVVGASPAASADFRAVDYPSSVVLLLGCESRGLCPEQQAICDATVRIPMCGRCDSLNLATAACVLLYQAMGRGNREQGTEGSRESLTVNAQHSDGKRET